MNYCTKINDDCPRCKNDKYCLFTGRPRLIKSLDKCPMNYYIKKEAIRPIDEQTDLF